MRYVYGGHGNRATRLDRRLFVRRKPARIKFFEHEAPSRRQAARIPVRHPGVWALACSGGACQFPRAKLAMRAWRQSAKADRFVRELRAFRERVRAAVLRLESGSLPAESFVDEVNHLLTKYPRRSVLVREGRSLVRKYPFEPDGPEAFWAPDWRGGCGAVGRNGPLSNAKMRILRGSFPGHQQKRLAALVQHEHLRQQGQSGQLSATQTQIRAACLKFHQKAARIMRRAA